MSNSKIILSDKQVSKELKNLVEAFTEPTDKDIKKHENYFKNLKNYLNKLLKNKFPFIDHVDVESKLKNLIYNDKYYYYIVIDLYIDIPKLPEQEDLHKFIKIFHDERKWSANNMFTKLEYFYEKNKEDYNQLNNDVIELSYFYMDVLYEKLNLNPEDYGYSFYFRY